MELSSLGQLSRPWNLMLLKAGQSIRLQVSQFLEGTIEIHPKDEPGPKTIGAMRLFATRLDRRSSEPYFDVTYTQLQEQLRPLLENRFTANNPITITARGYRRRKTFQIEVAPT